MGYAFEESPEELEPQASGSRRGGPPRYGTTVGLIDRPDASLPRQSIPIAFKEIAAIIGLSLLLLGVALLLVCIIQHR
jgi:hypothetical protein